MIVSQLITILKGLDPTLEVVLPVNVGPELTIYSPCAEHSLGLYTPDTEWSGEFNSYIENEYGDTFKIEEPNAVCFWNLLE